MGTYVELESFCHTLNHLYKLSFCFFFINITQILILIQNAYSFYLSQKHKTRFSLFE